MGIEIFGTLATLIILVSFLQTTTLRIRIVNSIGSLMFVIYGLTIGAFSVWLLNGMCILINVYYILKYVRESAQSYKGAIVIGYPGIGKTTASAQDNRFIDLDSSTFSEEGYKVAGWEVSYCRCAIDLAQNGYIVFVSSHNEVRKYLSTADIPRAVKVLLCYPAMELQLPWEIRLVDRWMEHPTEKNHRACVRVSDEFESDIKELEAENFTSIVLTDTEYDLRSNILKLLR